MINMVVQRDGHHALIHPEQTQTFSTCLAKYRQMTKTCDAETSSSSLEYLLILPSGTDVEADATTLNEELRTSTLQNEELRTFFDFDNK